MMNLKALKIDSSWTLFLDRDGVINKKLDNDYVKKIEEFEFIEGSKEAISDFSKVFGRIVVVTNQQGIGKGLMSKEDLQMVHDYMQAKVEEVGGRFDQIYYCPELAAANAKCRKPNTGMAESAQSDFPDIDFQKSIMVGDSLSDMQMGRRAGMLTVYITPTEVEMEEADLQIKALKELEGLI